MEILFKAKRADGKGWQEGYVVKGFADSVLMCSEQISGEHTDRGQKVGFFNRVIPETVSQFTGKQIEGINLFKGDKIKSFHFRERKNHYLEHIVLWNNEYSCWMASSDGTTEIKDGNVFLYIFLKNAIEPKIICNIHDDGK